MIAAPEPREGGAPRRPQPAATEDLVEFGEVEVQHEQGGVEIPATDPRSFVQAAIRAGFLTLEEDPEI